MKNKNLHTILSPLILSVGIIIGVLAVNLFDLKKPNAIITTEEPGKGNKLIKILDYVKREYVDTVNMNELIEESLPEILKNLDPHSLYIPASEYEKFNEPLKGNFEGIGVQFNIEKDTIIVVNTISGGPSAMVGILPGDRIVEINDTVFVGKKVTNKLVMKKLRGPKDSKVKVGILRKSRKDLIDFIITRDKIPLYSVDVSYMIKNDIGYIKISRFAQNTYGEFLSAVKKLKFSGMKKLIVDLRGNSGGYLTAAINIADQFLGAGKPIVYTEGRNHQRITYTAEPGGAVVNEEVVILLDEWSASASEILAGAIQDNDRGTIVGRRSFGKGLVQEETGFSDGSSVRLTVARYYTPTGRCIQKPYDDYNSYMNDIGQRYINGEMAEEDSIFHPDSLKYTTPGGKIVYGGGGIMPDVFVPVDTTGISDYLTEVTGKGLIYKFAFNYADNHRKQLSRFTTYPKLNQYLEGSDILSQFIKYAEENGIAENEADVETSKMLLKNYLKAHIARNILDNEGFFPILHERDNTLKKAVKQF